MRRGLGHTRGVLCRKEGPVLLPRTSTPLCESFFPDNAGAEALLLSLPLCPWPLPGPSPVRRLGGASPGPSQTCRGSPFCESAARTHSLPPTLAQATSHKSRVREPQAPSHKSQASCLVFRGLHCDVTCDQCPVPPAQRQPDLTVHVALSCPPLTLPPPLRRDLSRNNLTGNLPALTELTRLEHL